MKIGICDDEEIYREAIGAKLTTSSQKLSFEMELHFFDDGESLLRNQNLQDFDVILIDIEMPKLNGFELTEKIKAKNKNIIIVFISNSSSRVYSSLKYAPFRFIRKSELAIEIDELLEALAKELSDRSVCICFDTKNETIKVEINKIAFFEIYGHELICHTSFSEVKIKGSLREMEKTMSKHGFVKTHNSYLVNMNYIYSIGKTEIKLIDSLGCVPLARTRINEVKKKFIRFVR